MFLLAHHFLHHLSTQLFPNSHICSNLRLLKGHVTAFSSSHTISGPPGPIGLKYLHLSSENLQKTIYSSLHYPAPKSPNGDRR